MKDKKNLRNILLVALGLSLGQLLPFFLIPTPTWMIVDKILFGFGIGVGISVLLIAVGNYVFKIKN